MSAKRSLGTDHLLVADHRNYTVVNTEKGLVEVQKMTCAGMKLSCQLKVQSSLWTATEVIAHVQSPLWGRFHHCAAPGP